MISSTSLPEAAAGDEPTAPVRASRFKEHTNTMSSIRPPPDDFLDEGMGVENLIAQFNAENAEPATRSGEGKGRGVGAVSVVQVNSNTVREGQSGQAASAVQAGGESVVGRLWRPFASVLGGVWGKKRTGSVDFAAQGKEGSKERERLDERKRAADRAYAEAKEKGLLPTPKVFVRPGLVGKGHKCVVDTPAATPARTPRDPSTLHRTPSKKDLTKQKRLSRRVSQLEDKLASAKKELQAVLGDDVPPMPALPMQPLVQTNSQAETALLTPDTSHSTQPSNAMLTPSPEPPSSVQHPPAPVPSPADILTSPNAHEYAHEQEHAHDAALDTPSIPRPRKTTTISSTTTAPKTRKRKAATLDPSDPAAPYKPTRHSSADPDTDGLMASSPERSVKRVKSTAGAGRKGSRRGGRGGGEGGRKRGGRGRGSVTARERELESEDEVVRVVPDGIEVPVVPALPQGVVAYPEVMDLDSPPDLTRGMDKHRRGDSADEMTRRAGMSPKKKRVVGGIRVVQGNIHGGKGDDGYGGLEHEMF